mmetsp:Transcript_3776/g.7507  ORF Transcript_3776/g.7507 Transcript_3776/m.7507 type:complete len:227 (-) Transcript_3776:1873-2553(-)
MSWTIGLCGSTLELQPGPRQRQRRRQCRWRPFQLDPQFRRRLEQQRRAAGFLGGDGKTKEFQWRWVHLHVHHHRSGRLGRLRHVHRRRIEQSPFRGTASVHVGVRSCGDIRRGTQHSTDPLAQRGRSSHFRRFCDDFGPCAFFLCHPKPRRRRRRRRLVAFRQPLAQRPRDQRCQPRCRPPSPQNRGSGRSHAPGCQFECCRRDWLEYSAVTGRSPFCPQFGSIGP